MGYGVSNFLKGDAITADLTAIRFFYIIQISHRIMREFSKYFNMKVCDIIRF